MSNIPEHIKWLVDTGERISTVGGKTVEVWELRHQPDDEVLSAWAKHFRNHYCSDDEIDYFRRGYGYSRAEFLNKIKFPDLKKPPGPSIRAGDFGEILIADYLEFILGFWVPRARYGAKATHNESSKGCDTLGFLFADDGKESPEDTMVVYEVKARLTADIATVALAGIKVAIKDSAKDEVRIADSLNYLKQRLFDKRQLDQATKIERFQNPVDHPYQIRFGAAAILATESYDPKTISIVDANEHPHKDKLYLIIVHGEQLMELVQTLYQRAADEA